MAKSCALHFRRAQRTSLASILQDTNRQNRTDQRVTVRNHAILMTRSQCQANTRAHQQRAEAWHCQCIITNSESEYRTERARQSQAIRKRLFAVPETIECEIEPIGDVRCETLHLAFEYLCRRVSARGRDARSHRSTCANQANELLRLNDSTSPNSRCARCSNSNKQERLRTENARRAKSRGERQASRRGQTKS